MWGKRFTPMQKARLFVASGTMWGYPFGSLGLFGAPIGYAANKALLNSNVDLGNYIPGGSAIQTILTAGVPAYLTQLLTGTLYDFSRYGVRGWGLLTGLFSDDARWYSFLGAMPNGLINTYLRSAPLWQDIAGLMHGISTTVSGQVAQNVGVVPGYEGGDWSKFNPTTEDFADLFKEWSGFSYGHRLYQSLRYGVHMSNNNNPIRENVTTGQAITAYLTGLVPEDVSNLTSNFGILADRNARKEFLIRQGQRNFNLALLSLKDNPDPDNNPQYQTFMRKMKAILEMAPNSKDQQDIMKTIVMRNKPLVESVEERLSKFMATEEDREKFRKRIELREGQ